MNILFWILQIVIALHTAIGALWKFSNPVQTLPSLRAIPNGLWLAMGGFEILCSICLVIPIFYRPFAFLAPLAAICIAAEMLFFSGLHLYSGDTHYGPVIYWLVVAAICAFIAYVRLAVKP